MILRRLTEHARAQNWFAVPLDFLIVVAGVFVGIQVANWNGARIQRALGNDYTVRIIADPELGHLFQRGCRDYQALSEKERARMVHVFFSFFKMFERIYLHHRHGAVEAEVWLSNREMLLAYASQPGARYYLSHREKIFDAGFWRFLNESRDAEVAAGHVVSQIALEDSSDEAAP